MVHTPYSIEELPASDGGTLSVYGRFDAHTVDKEDVIIEHLKKHGYDEDTGVIFVDGLPVFVSHAEGVLHVVTNSGALDIEAKKLREVTEWVMCKMLEAYRFQG